MGFPGGPRCNELTFQCRRHKRCRLTWIPDLERSSGEGNESPLQYSCLENPTDRGAWWAIVMGSQRVRHN